MAEGVVVLLEAVEIEEREQQRLVRSRRGESRIQIVQQGAAVAQARERIRERFLAAGGQQQRVLARQALGAPEVVPEGDQQQEDRAAEPAVACASDRAARSW